MKANQFDGDLMSALESAVKADAPARPRRKREPAPACLAYAGAMGHTWVATAYGPDGAERVYCQAGSGPRAYEAWKELRRYGGRIFTRTRKGWKLVTPSRAAIS